MLLDRITLGVVITAIIVAGVSFGFLYKMVKKKEGFIGTNQNTLSSQSCRMPYDYNAKQIAYCETLPDLGDKTGCYLQCITNYPGGVRGKCYPNLLKTYNSYAKEYGNAGDFPILKEWKCQPGDPCCYKNDFDVYSYATSEFLDSEGYSPGEERTSERMGDASLSAPNHGLYDFLNYE